MEELKSLVQVLKDLPHTAVWAIIAFLLYKLSVLASIYATIRFVVDRAIQAYIAEVTKPIVTTVKLANGLALGDNVQNLIELQLMRLRKHSQYVHESDVLWLSQVLDKALPERK